MTNKEFKIWLLTNDYTQSTLAEKLGITTRTISNYISNGFPKMFLLALKALEV